MPGTHNTLTGMAIWHSYLSYLDVRAARQWADTIMATDTMLTPNYTGISTPDRFFIGYLGELAVAAFLQMNDCRHRHRVDTRGRSCDSEFVVWRRDGRPAKLEVKCASSPMHTRLMMPAAQRLDGDVYVGCRLEHSSAEGAEVSVHGWLTRAEVRALPVRTFATYSTPTRHAMLDRLRPLASLLSFLQHQPATIEGVSSGSRTPAL